MHLLTSRLHYNCIWDALQADKRTQASFTSVTCWWLNQLETIDGSYTPVTIKFHSSCIYPDCSNLTPCAYPRSWLTWCLKQIALITTRFQIINTDKFKMKWSFPISLNFLPLLQHFLTQFTLDTSSQFYQFKQEFLITGWYAYLKFRNRSIITHFKAYLGLIENCLFKLSSSTSSILATTTLFSWATTLLCYLNYLPQSFNCKCSPLSSTFSHAYAKVMVFYRASNIQFSDDC